jgi:hypothetical protein
MSHPDLTTIVYVVSREFNNFTYDELNILTNIITNYKKFALVTFEPYLDFNNWALTCFLKSSYFCTDREHLVHL